MNVRGTIDAVNILLRSFRLGILSAHTLAILVKLYKCRRNREDEKSTNVACILYLIDRLFIRDCSLE